jgi:uncharacterized protein (TIGR02646 family)
MREITKNPEPNSLIQHRLKNHCDFDNYQSKDELRYSLVSEQRGLCCYCMGRIQAHTASMKIEHWHCQSKYINEQLEYNNLLGSCLGGEGQPSHLQHCDTRKGDQDILFNPADPNHRIEYRIKYKPDGTIYSEDSAFNTQLNEILNLNIPFLKNNRKNILSSILVWWCSINKARSKIKIDNKIQKYETGNSLEPYCQVAIWWLKQKTMNRN